YLSLTGYRLPTEAEIEYATRAGTVTSRYFGDSEELLGNYAWYSKNSSERTWPVGIKKPNDLGLFDVQGNAFTWCQETFKAYPQAQQVADDKEDAALVVISTKGRVLRGGSFGNLAAFVRSAVRVICAAGFRDLSIGFRPARTYH